MSAAQTGMSTPQKCMPVFHQRVAVFDRRLADFQIHGSCSVDIQFYARDLRVSAADIHAYAADMDVYTADFHVYFSGVYGCSQSTRGRFPDPRVCPADMLVYAADM